MKYTFSKEDSETLYKMFQDACRALKLPRKRTRAIMKVGRKYRKAGPTINLKPPEVKLTCDFLSLNIRSIERAILHMALENPDLKSKCEVAHQTYTRLYDYFKKIGELNETP